MRIVNEIRLSQVVGPRHKDSVDFVMNWKPGQKVPNPRYIEYKNDVSRAFAIATGTLDGANAFKVWGAQQRDGEEAFHKYSFPASVFHVPGFLKRAPKQLKKIQSLNATKMIKVAINACKPWEEIAGKIKAMKGDVVKRQVGVGAGNKPTAANIGTLSKEIEDELEKIGKGFETDLQANFEDHFHGLLDKYKADVKTTGKTNPYDFYKTKATYGRIEILRRLLDGDSRFNYTIKTDYKSVITKLAKQSAKDAVISFVEKMKIKLTNIVGSRKLAVDVDGNSNRNTITFEFEDKSRFTVRNSIVLSYSMYGTPFYRYPTTFHNVILPNGKKLNSPSEAKIKKEFAI